MPGKRWFWLAVVVQVLLLMGLVGRHGYTLMTGAPIRLQTVPVDPWDPLRGEYVQLSYSISQLEEGKVQFGGREFESGQTVWVTLRPGDPYWTAEAVSDGRPAALAGGAVALRGTVMWSRPPGESGPIPNEGRLVAIRYGIEQFYVPEGEGPRLEGRQAEMIVEAKVDRFGRAALHRVFLEGRELHWR